MTNHVKGTRSDGSGFPPRVHRFRTERHCRNLSEGGKRAAAAGKVDATHIIAHAKARRIVLSSEERSALVMLYWRGVDMDIIAQRVGVSRDIIRRERNAMGLGSRRKLKGFYKWKH